MTQAPIRLLITGGTFDKTYDEIHGRLSFGDTHLPEMLRLGRSHVDVSVRTLNAEAGWFRANAGAV